MERTNIVMKKISNKNLIKGVEGWEFCKGVYIIRTIEGPGEWDAVIDNQQFSDAYLPKEEVVIIRDALTEAIDFMSKEER
jgi:hypothetical protein